MILIQLALSAACPIIRGYLDCRSYNRGGGAAYHQGNGLEALPHSTCILELVIRKGVLTGLEHLSLEQSFSCSGGSLKDTLLRRYIIFIYHVPS